MGLDLISISTVSLYFFSHYANMSVQFTATFHGGKKDNFKMKHCDIFPIFAQIIDRGYTLDGTRSLF